jgi:hypothetical protein
MEVGTGALPSGTQLLKRRLLLPGTLMFEVNVQSTDSVVLSCQQQTLTGCGHQRRARRFVCRAAINARRQADASAHQPVACRARSAIKCENNAPLRRQARSTSLEFTF